MPGWRIVLWVVLVITTLLFLYLVRGILLPFVLAGIISALLDPTVNKLRKRGWPKGLAISALVLVFIGGFAAVGVFLTPIVTQQVSGLRDRVDDLTANLIQPDTTSNFFVRWNPVQKITHPPESDPVESAFRQNQDLLARLSLPTTKREFVRQYIEPQRPQVGKWIQGFFQGFLGAASGIVSQVLVLLFVPLLVFLMLSNLDQFKRRSITWIPPALRKNTLSVMSDIGQVFVSYLRGVTIAVLGYMAFMSLTLTILNAPYSVLLGVLFGALYLVPYLNVAISGTVLFLVTGLSGRTGDLLMTTASPWTFAAILLAIYIACHFTFDTLVYPRFVGRAVGLDPVVSMFVIFSGGALFGLVGMIIAFPLAGAVKVILDRLIRITSTSHEGLSLPSVPLRHRGSA